MIDYSRLKREILCSSVYKNLISQPAYDIQKHGTYDRSRFRIIEDVSYSEV